MSRHMRRTTVRLDDVLLDRVKEEAARRGETVTSLIELGLTLVLAQKSTKRRVRISLPVSREKGGTLPGVDLADTASLIDIMEGRE